MPLSSRLVDAIRANPRRSLVAVVFFLVVAGVVGGPVAGALDSEGGFAPADAESTRGLERIEAATGKSAGPGVVLVVDNAAAGAETVAAELESIDGVAEVAVAGVSTDETQTMVIGYLDSDASGPDVAAEVLDAFDEDGVTVGGPAVAGKQLGDQVAADLGRAELFALPILTVLAILFFGLRGAVLPVVVGATTVLGTFLVLAGINATYDLSVFALNLVIGLGLGLAIDYTLFLISRYREELTTQGDTPQAVLTTMRTAGRTVVYSATTVAVALATLIVFPLGFLRSMGIAGATVAVAAAIASLLVTPAFLGLWGGKLARRSHRQSAERAGGRWYAFSHAVMRRPGSIALVTAVLMMILAAPALRAEWSPVDDSVIPEDLSSRAVSQTLAEEFPQAHGVVTVALLAGEQEVADYAVEASEFDAVLGAGRPMELDNGVWQLDLAVPGDAAGEDARQVVHDARELAAASNVDALVVGPAAEFIDQQSGIGDTLPLGVGLLVLLTLLVLWLMTGSIVLPIKAVIMNVLTVGVALGAIVFVYQDGRFTGLLGYTPNGGVESADFLIAAAVVFALSTDYGVFLLGRIKEARDGGLGEREAVATGLGRTGSVVTAAAILLAVAIGAFSTSAITFIQQIGVAVAIGVIVDAFVVRSLLVPSLMALMGRWNWWSPMWLRRIHDQLGLRDGAHSAPLVAEERAPVGGGR